MLVMGTDDCNGHSNKVTSSGSTSQSTSCSSISPENPSYGSVIADSLPEITEDLGPKFRILRRTDQIHELQTKLRNVETSRSEFKFVADRLIRMVIEEGLNQLRKYSVVSIKRTGCNKQTGWYKKYFYYMENEIRVVKKYFY